MDRSETVQGRQMTTTTVPRRDPAALTGLLFGAVTISSVLVTDILISGTRPRPSAPDAVLQRFVLDNAGVLRLQAVTGVIAAVLLAAFAATLAAMARRAEHRPTGLPEAVLVGGMLAAGFAAVSWLLLGTLSAEQITDSPVTVSAVRQLNFLTGGAGHVIWLGMLVGSVSLVGHRTAVLPRWLTGAGFVSAILSTLALASLAADPFLLFIPLGRFSAVLVLAGTSVLVATGRTAPRTETSARSAVLGGIGLVVLAFALTIAV